MKLREITARAVLLRTIGLGVLVGFLIASMTTASAQTEEVAGLRIVHAGIDTPPLNVSVDGEPVAEDFFWLEASDYMDVAAGDHEISIFDPDTSLDEALSTVTITTEAGNNYSAVVTGEMPQPSIVLIVDGDEGGLEPGTGAVRFFHSVPDAGPIDVVASDGMLFVEGLAPMTAGAYASVLPGTYDIEFREAGTDTVLYTESGVIIDGGAFQTAYLSGLAELTNFAAETFVDELRGESGGEEPTATEEPQPTATVEPTATPEPVIAMPSTGAGGMAPTDDSWNPLLFGSLAVLCLAAGGSLLFWSRRVT